jgi:hypothetical protein
MRCRVCGELLELREVPASEGRAGDLRVELYGLRLARCAAADHPAEPPASHFAADLAAAALAGDAIPAVRRRGWFGRGRPSCFRCGAELGEAPPAPAEVRARLRVAGGAPLTLTVAGPARACPECRLVQLEDTAALGEAVIGALRAAGLALPE